MTFNSTSDNIGFATFSSAQMLRTSQSPRMLYATHPEYYKGRSTMSKKPREFFDKEHQVMDAYYDLCEFVAL